MLVLAGLEPALLKPWSYLLSWPRMSAKNRAFVSLWWLEQMGAVRLLISGLKTSGADKCPPPPHGR